MKRSACAAYTTLLALSVCLLLPAHARAGVVFSNPVVYFDPLGDTFTGSGAGVVHDIVAIESRLSAGQIEFNVRFAAPIAAPSDLGSVRNLTGFLDLDVDQNPATGATSQKSMFSPAGPSGLGTEFYVDLFSEEFQPGLADIVDTATGLATGTAAVAFDEQMLSILIDLAKINSDDGRLHYGLIVGDFIDSTDEARNSGLPVATTAPILANPEPSTIAVWMVICTVGVWYAKRCREPLLLA